MTAARQREDIRRAAVSRTEAGRDALIVDAVENAAPGLTGPVGVAATSTWDPGDPVTVTVTYPEDITVVGIRFFQANLVSRRTARVEH